MENNNIYEMFAKNIVDIKTPGMVTSKTGNNYGSGFKDKRIVYYFETQITNLFKSTKKKLGKKKAFDFIYQIGHDIGVGYIVRANLKIASLLPNRILLNKIFKFLSIGGFSVVTNVRFGKDEIVFEGSNSMICRKTRSVCFTSGVLVGLVSAITKKKYIAQSECSNCPKGCNIILKKTNENFFVTNNLKSFFQSKKESQPKIKTKKDTETIYKLMKFKKVEIKNKLELLGQMLIPTEAVMLEIIAHRFKEVNESEFFNDEITKSTEKIISSIFKNQSKQNKLKLFQVIICSMGWGVVEIKQSQSEISVSTYYSPLSSSIEFYKNFLNGTLNSIYNKKFIIKNLSRSYNNIKIIFA